MNRRLQFGGLIIALAISAGMALPSAAQNRNANRPPQPQQRPAARPAQRQPITSPKPQSGRPNSGRPASNARPNRFPTNQPNESSGARNGGNRPTNTGGESARQPNVNPNRPPNATNSQAGARRFQDLSPAEKQKVMENREKFNRLPPQRQQELREAAQNWRRLTPEQQNHIKNNVLPQWKQLPSDRQRAIRQRLGVLQNMPESARNQHLNDPNFTRGMSEEDKTMLRDLSHMHVGAPDPPME